MDGSKIDSIHKFIENELLNQKNSPEPEISAIDTVQIDRFIQIADSLLYKNPARSFALSRALTELSDKINYKKGAVMASNLMAGFYWITGDYQAAISQIKTNLPATISYGDSTLLGNQLLNIGILYYEIKDYPSAIEFTRKSLDFIKDNNKKLADAYNNLGLYNLKLNHFDSAGIYLHKSLSIKKEIGYTDYIAETYNNIGLNYLNKKQFDSAKYCFHHAISHSQRYSPWEEKGLCNTYLNFANYYIQVEDFGRAKLYTDSAWQISTKNNFRPELAEAHYNYWIILYELHDYEGAYKSRSALDSLNQADSTLLFIRDFERSKEFLFAFFNRANEFRKPLPRYLQLDIQYFSLGLMLVALGLFSALAYFLKVMRDRRIASTKIAAIEAEKNTIHKNLNEIQQKLISVEIAKDYQKRTFEEVKEQVLALNSQNPIDIKKEIENIQRSFDTTKISQSNWNRYEVLFEASHPSYIHNLKNKFPEITNTEIRLLILILMNVPTKQIADILTVSPNTIKTMRYRIKKKIGLDKEANLDDYLNQTLDTY